MQTSRVLIDGIEVGARLRQIDPERVDALVASIAEIGLRTPITVMSRANGDDTRLILVAGLHRLEALKRIGEESTDVIIVPDDEVQAELWEIAENLHRADLTKEQRDVQIRRYAELLQLKVRKDQSVQSAPIVSKRQDGKGHRQTGLAKKIAEQTGLSKSTVRRALFRPDPEIEVQRQEAEKARRDHDRAIETIAAEAFAGWIVAQSDLDQIPQIIAWLEGAKPKQVIDAIHRLVSDALVMDRSVA